MGVKFEIELDEHVVEMIHLAYPSIPIEKFVSDFITSCLIYSITQADEILKLVDNNPECKRFIDNSSKYINANLSRGIGDSQT